MMLKVGITGGIGTGKSVVCNLFAVLGIQVYNADQRAKALVLANQTYCEIRVVDDGKGYIPGERKSGLLNLERRALARGGEFEILGNTVSGTRTMWRVSL